MAAVDPEKLKRTVVNVVDNALKYMENEHKRFEITLQADEKWITMGFKDNGRGIPEEALPYIFERFYRAEQSRNSSTGGSGLGLAIARQIIDGHGGFIWAESQPNDGTSIYIKLKRLNEERD